VLDTSRQERAYQYRLLVDRLQFHLDAGNLPADISERVNAAKEALAEAAEMLAALDADERQNA
jgi:hypothetical protein